MPSSKSYTHQKTGLTLDFDEETHTYTSLPPSVDPTLFTSSPDSEQFRIKYISASTWVGNWFPPFDAVATAKRVATRRGDVSAEDVMKEWDEKKNAACILGTRVHEVCEDVMLNRAIRNSPANDHERKLMFHGFNKAKEVREKSTTVCAEQMLFDSYLQIAGTADIITITPDKVVNILDWKTNDKEISPDAKAYQFGRHPIEWIPDNSYWHYVLQLNMYQFLIERMEIFPPDTQFRRALFHIREDGVATIQIPDYSKLIRDLVLFYALNEGAVGLF